MGYTISIGELIEVTDEDGYTYSDVKDERHENAPAFDEPTDYTNSRWPSYTQWSKAMESVGLYRLFYAEPGGLIRPHPGCVALTLDHKMQIDEADQNYRAQYPNARAGYGPTQDPNLVRLEWLKYWVDWALENCQRPVIVNC